MLRKARLMSRVKSEVERPYLTEFTMRTVSSQSSTGMTDVTGPKISSMAMRASGFTSPKKVGRKKEPLPRRPAAAPQAGPPATDGGVRRDALDRLVVDDRPDIGPLVQAVAQDQGRHALAERLHELVVDRPMHDQAWGGRGGVAA